MKKFVPKVLYDDLVFDTLNSLCVYYNMDRRTAQKRILEGKIVCCSFIKRTITRYVFIVRSDFIEKTDKTVFSTGKEV